MLQGPFHGLVLRDFKTYQNSKHYGHCLHQKPGDLLFRRFARRVASGAPLGFRQKLKCHNVAVHRAVDALSAADVHRDTLVVLHKIKMNGAFSLVV